MNMFKFTIYTSLIFVIILAHCSKTPNDTGELPRELTIAEKKLAKANQSFSIDIFKKVITTDSSSNVFISPLSISVALGMTMNGAKGQTFEEMRETLGFSNIELPEINEGYESLIRLLTSIDPKVQMEIANSVWNRKEFTIEEAFRQNLVDHFNAEAMELDFDDPKAEDFINDWVYDNTNKKIEKIIDGIPSEMVMYLINAVYFKGSWLYEFNTEATQERSFFTTNGTSVETDMMNQQSSLPFYISDKVAMVDLPYGDDLFTTTLLMPANYETEINDFIKSDLTTENLTSWYQELSTNEVGVVLPKLELEYKIRLNDVLIAMGMPTAFTNGADLSGINGNGGLLISEVLHKTYLKMDEEGSEAAAVTSVGIGVTSAPSPSIPSIFFDRPYVMILRERNSGTILFIGKIENPELD